MVSTLIQLSQHPQSGFYLYNFENLRDVLLQLNEDKQPTLLFGVTFALLDFASKYNIDLSHVTIIETGGMKGRGKEPVRHEVHAYINGKLKPKAIHSEYGMTELLSQAYAIEKGIFQCPVWMRALIRDENDPLTTYTSGKGVLNIIDLANLDSCCFIATEDVGIVHKNETFEIWGRLDNSEARGCNLLVADLLL
jgi:Acyl-protein synthetase, LuxE